MINPYLKIIQYQYS